MRIKLLLVALCSLTLFGQQAPLSPEADRALLNRCCSACHSQNAKKAGLESAQRITLDNLDTAHVEKNPEEWERVVRNSKANSTAMRWRIYRQAFTG
jgi:hypothetical protein